MQTRTTAQQKFIEELEGLFYRHYKRLHSEAIKKGIKTKKAKKQYDTNRNTNHASQIK
jgi:hypothetical protein